MVRSLYAIRYCTYDRLGFSLFHANKLTQIFRKQKKRQKKFRGFRINFIDKSRYINFTVFLHFINQKLLRGVCVWKEELGAFRFV